MVHHESKLIMADGLVRDVATFVRRLCHSVLLFAHGLLLPLTFRRLLKIIGDEMPL